MAKRNNGPYFVRNGFLKEISIAAFSCGFIEEIALSTLKAVFKRG